MKETLIATLIGLPIGIFASLMAWYIVWRLISPRIEISPEVAKPPSDSELTTRRGYRVKIKNVRKRDAMELAYHAQLRYKRNNDLTGNWAILRVPLSSKTRAILGNNALIWIDSLELSDRHREYLPSNINGTEFDIKLLLQNLPEAQLIFTCIAAHSFSGSRKSFTQKYDATAVVEAYYRPDNPLGRWRTWLRINLEERTHPELETIDAEEAERYSAQRRARPI